jgi:hypothetical protein
MNICMAQPIIKTLRRISTENIRVESKSGSSDGSRLFFASAILLMTAMDGMLAKALGPQQALELVRLRE